MGRNSLNYVGAKILIVEDEILVALQIEDMVKSNGHEVLATLSDRASLDRLQDAPDIALVDLNLRDGLTGPEIARCLARRFGCKVVYVTATPGDIDIPASTAIGVVQKPFSSSAILGAIEYAMHGNPQSCPKGLEPIAHRSAA